MRGLVFLDESFCNTSMAREYGWAPVGQRARGVRPGGRWTTWTLVGAIRVGCRPKLLTHRGAINGTHLRAIRPPAALPVAPSRRRRGDGQPRSAQGDWGPSGD
ncbi:transposase [Corallococcus exiguus]|nr:transposase [Corallococcus exiguus]